MERALGDLCGFPVGSHGVGEPQVAVGETAVGRVRTGVRVLEQAEQLLDLGRADVVDAASEVVEVVAIRREGRVCRGPLEQLLAPEREQLGLDERERRRDLAVHRLRAAEAGDGGLVAGVDRVVEVRIHEDVAEAAAQVVARRERLQRDRRALREPPREPLELPEIGDECIERIPPRLRRLEDAGGVPRPLHRDGATGRGCGVDCHSGMLPCFRFGFGSRFVSAVSSAEKSTGRVRRGSITSST